MQLNWWPCRGSKLFSRSSLESFISIYWFQQSPWLPCLIVSFNWSCFGRFNIESLLRGIRGASGKTLQRLGHREKPCLNSTAQFWQSQLLFNEVAGIVVGRGPEDDSTGHVASTMSATLPPWEGAGNIHGSKVTDGCQKVQEYCQADVGISCCRVEGELYKVDERLDWLCQASIAGGALNYLSR